MVFQIFYRFDSNKNQTLIVAETDEAFQNTTIKELKEKIRAKIPGRPDLNVLKLKFGPRELEDGKTVQCYSIQHQSLIFISLQLPGGADPSEDKWRLHITQKPKERVLQDEMTALY